MISIAVATYNGEKYICEQIDSILAQTVQDFELIVCDDCSTDGTVEILNKYAEKDGRIKIFVNEMNLGFKKNFEKAIRLCSGEYIALSDQDDIWLPKHLEKLIDIIGDADIACGNARLVDKDGIPTGQLLNETCNFYALYEEHLLYRLLCNSGLFQGASMLIKKKFLMDSAVLPLSEGVLYHDAWFAACACLRRGIQYTFDVITLYRQHEKNASGTKKRWSYFSALFKTFFFQTSDYKTDRFEYIKEMKNRFSLSETQEKILEECRIFLQLNNRKLSFREKLKCLSWYWKMYKYIFTSKTNKYRLSRTIKLFLTK